MAYSLRPRSMRNQLLENPESDEEVVEQSDEIFSSSDNEGISCSSEAEDNEDVEMENPCLNARANQSRARGRPVTKLRGKNGFVWNTTFASRRSGT